jgi:MEMO1 family protein
MSDTLIRPSTLAGRWYPADPGELRASVSGMIRPSRSVVVPDGRPVVIVVPHAGHSWSGAVAGQAYDSLRGFDYERVVLLAPNHRFQLAAVSSPTDDAYATPLGQVALDIAGREFLQAKGGVFPISAAHADEHAEEIQLPFLQVLWNDPPPVLPLLVPRLTVEQRRQLAAALGRWCDGRTLFIVSTDFTHYGNDFGYLPFTDDIAAQLAQLDGGALDCLTSWDAEKLIDYGDTTGITMCGLEATALAMSVPWPEKPTITQLAYERSGDRDGDFSLSVSYAALVGVLEKNG